MGSSREPPNRWNSDNLLAVMVWKNSNFILLPLIWSQECGLLFFQDYCFNWDIGNVFKASQTATNSLFLEIFNHFLGHSQGCYKPWLVFRVLKMVILPVFAIFFHCFHGGVNFWKSFLRCQYHHYHQIIL